MRLIDADALPKYNGYALSADNVANAVEHAPTIDAKPVRRGRWEYDDISELKYCSECYFGKERMDKRIYNFCPNCGARMDGERREV